MTKKQEKNYIIYNQFINNTKFSRCVTESSSLHFGMEKAGIQCSLHFIQCLCFECLCNAIQSNAMHSYTTTASS